MIVPDPNEAEPTQPTQPKGIDPKTGKPYEPVEIPVPKRAEWERILRRGSEPAKPDGRSDQDRPSLGA
jgi:hypothetical protein